MKKIFILLTAWCLSGTMLMLNAQNRIDNASFETWDAGVPTSWTTEGGAITLSQETTNVQNGTSACKVVFTSQSNQDLKSNTFAVTPGETLAGSVRIYDNDETGKARISLLYEGASNYYGSYSQDSPDWQELSFNEVVPEGATAATFQVRFYDESSTWTGSAEILVDNAVCMTNTSVNPEPTNYPSAFSANADRLNIDLSWTDATGSQLPDGYLILGSTTDNIAAPVDGTAIENDTDFADGSFAVNVAMDKEHYFVGMQNGIDVNKNYYFKIYPYTNGGNDIDYKTDASAPAANTNTPNTSVILATTFASDLENWTAVSVIGDEQVWNQSSYQGTTYAMMNGYAGGPNPNEDWLISPDMTVYNDLVLSFRSAYKFNGPALELFYSTNYSSGNPNDANWTALAAEWSDGNYHWVASGNINLPHEGGLRIAFKYTSTDSQSSKWQVTDILVTGSETAPNPATQLSISNVNNGEAIYQGQGFSLQVKALNAEGTVANVDTDVNVNLSVQTGSGQLSGTTSATLAAGSNIITIEGLSYDVAENGVVLQVSDAAANLSSGQSAPFDVLEVSYAPLIITEIMYNPPESGVDSLEYIELFNNSTEAVGIGGYTFTNGIEYTLPNINVAPASYFLIAKDSAAIFRQLGVESLQWTSGSLKNSGESIVLSATDGTVIDSVAYSDSEPWPTLADGHGPALSLCNPLSDNNEPSNWHASTNFITVNSNNDSIWGSPTMASTPVADFSSNTQQVYILESVEFTEECSCGATSHEWTFEGGEPATSNEANPTVLYANGGQFTVTLTASNATGSHTIVKEQYISVLDGIADITLEDISVNPNPSTDGYFTIRNPKQENIDIKIYDIMGKSVIKDYHIQSDAQIDLSTQNSGIYFLQMTSDSQQRTIKIIRK